MRNEECSSSHDSHFIALAVMRGFVHKMARGSPVAQQMSVKTCRSSLPWIQF